MSKSKEDLQTIYDTIKRDVETKLKYKFDSQVISDILFELAKEKHKYFILERVKHLSAIDAFNLAQLFNTAFLSTITIYATKGYDDIPLKKDPMPEIIITPEKKKRGRPRSNKLG